MVTVYNADTLPAIPAPEYRLVKCLKLLERLAGGDLNDASVVDVGCNLGQLCYHIKERFPDCEVHGVDDYITSEHDPTFNYQAHDVSTSLPYDDGQMHAVFALEVLEHMVDTDFFLQECLRILKPGGHLIITTPNICGLRNRLRVPLGLYPHMLEYRTVIHHVRLYNRAVLRKHLADTGFEEVDVRGTHLLPASWLERNRAAQSISDALATVFPTLSMGLLANARKPMEHA